MSDKLTEFHEVMEDRFAVVSCDALNDIITHYRHAVEKHPWFCDDICYTNYAWQSRARSLKDYICYHAKLHNRGEQSYCLAKDVLNAEIAEIYAAYSEGDLEQARYEIFDAIAVLLRMDDMIAEKQMEDGKC